MATEFNDTLHYGIFTTSATLTSQTGKMVRQSELVLAALRAQGVFDIMEDGATAPAIDKLWLDKNSDPAVLKEWDSISSTWQAMTFDRLFGRAIVTDLVNVGGTANAVTADEPSPFIDGRLYGLIPLAGNTGATTIQIAGVGTYDVVYPNGDDIIEGELVADLRTPLLFANGRFEIIFGANAGSVKRAETDASSFGFVLDEDDMASDSALKVPTQQSVNQGKLQKVATRTAMKALAGSKHLAVYLMELGREGIFQWDSSDLSSKVTIDTAEGIYVAPASDTTGASGAWVRQFDGAISAAWFGSETDETALNTAISTVSSFGGGDVIIADDFAVNASVILKSDVRLIGCGGSIKVADIADIHAIKIDDGASNWAIVGLEIDGNKANQSLGGHGITSSGSLLGSGVVRDNYIHDCYIDGIGFTSTESDGVIIQGNRVEDCGAANISCRSGTLKNSAIVGNVAKNAGTHNIGVTSIMDHVSILGNVCKTSGLSDTPADNITSYNNSNQFVTVSGNVCEDSGNNGIHISGTSDIVISSNIIDSPDQIGISMYLKDAANAVDGFSIVGNSVKSAGASGIWANNAKNGAIGINSIRSPGAHGILLQDSEGITVAGNIVTGAVAGSGIRTGGTNSSHAISGNVVKGCASSGINLPDVTGSTIVGNRCTGNVNFGITLSGTESDNSVQSNDVTGNTNSLGLLTASATTLCNDNKSDGSNFVASAATIAIPPHTDYISLTGSTNITSITASWPRRQVTLRSDGYTGTVADGSNLKLAGDIAPANNSTITLVCDGVNWYEIARSVN